MHLLCAAADLAFNSCDGEFSTSWTKDGPGPLLQLSQRDDVGGRDSLECRQPIVLRLAWDKEINLVILVGWVIVKHGVKSRLGGGGGGRHGELVLG